MQLIKENGFWIWTGDYTTKEIPKSAKFKWNSDLHQKYKPNLEVPLHTWWTGNIDKALLLKEYTSGEVLAELERRQVEINTQIDASIATDSDVVIPVPEGLNYYGYQKAGIVYGLANKNVLIADEMGLGKTIQAIGILNADKSINKTLIVCPASLKMNWLEELHAWLVLRTSTAINIISSKNTAKASADIHIISYNMLSSKKLDWLRKMKFDAIIADEAHYVKNNKAQRSKAYYKLAKKANRVIMLTGTPILNRPSELYHIIHSLGFKMTWWEYTNRYCDPQVGHFGRDISGASNMEELQVKLRSSIMIRRLKMDVLTDLPPKQRQIIKLDPTKYKSLIAAEQEYLGTIEQENPSKSIDDWYDDDYETNVSTLKEMEVTHIAEMSKLRHATAVAKIPDVIKHIETVLEQTDKIIVFAHHRDVINELYEAFEDRAVKLMGGMKDEDKNDSVKRFQTDPSINLFVGSIKAAGVGLTLTAANIVIFAELDWTPANLTQAEDRAHRIGQLNSVFIQHIVIDGSIDSNLAKRVVGKQNVIDKALNIKKVEEFKEKSEEVEPLIDERVENAKKFVKIMDGGRNFTDSEKLGILRKLRHLSDNSMGTEGVGFNRRDSSIGHVLAGKDFLTNRQASMGQDIIDKHVDQF